MEIACLGEMVDALVLTGGLEQVARRPNARHEGEERHHSRVFVTVFLLILLLFMGQANARKNQVASYKRLPQLPCGVADTL